MTHVAIANCPRPSDLTPYRVGEWLFEPELHRISRSGERHHLEPKLCQLLLFLLGNAGHVATKDEIIDGVWGTRFVADSALTRAVAELRRALGDDAHHPSYIETIPKRGYRLKASVRELPETVTAAADAAEAANDVEPGVKQAAESPRPSWRPDRAGPRARLALVLLSVGALIVTGGYATSRRFLTPDSLTTAATRDLRLAVLPLTNLAQDPAQDYFADGLTEALITQLARDRHLQVISRRSSQAFRGSTLPTRQIADALGVDGIVEGSVLRADDRVRITVQLTDASSETHLWAQSYERQMSDILALQSDVAHAITHEIGSLLNGTETATRREPEPHEAETLQPQKVDPQAYELFLKGRQSLDACGRQGPNQADELFRQALEIAPDYAPAYAGLALYYTRLASFGYMQASEALPLAREAADRALELDDSLGEAYLASAMVRFNFDWDWPAAERDFLRALELNPSDALTHERYSILLTCLGRFEEAAATAQRAVELDPLNRITRVGLGWVYFNAGRYDASLNELRRITELGLTDWPHGYISWNLALKGDYDAAISALEAHRQKPDSYSDETIHRSVLGWTLARAGRREEALDLAREIAAIVARTNGDPYGLAIVYAGLGDNDQAIAALEAAFAQRSPNMVYLRIEPFFEQLQNDPRYQQLRHAAGLG
ncbi:MAG: winged helix-turn-helix domain-containing protein [Acidobacteriota bacterium]